MLYGVVREQNRLTRLRLIVPELEKQVRRLEEEKQALTFEVLRFRSAKNLWKLKDQPQFAEMEFPTSDEVLVIE